MQSSRPDMPARTIFVPLLKPESAAPKGRNKDPAAQGCAETEGAKFSLKEEATALRTPPVRNGGCYKQPFTKWPVSCPAKRAGICLLGHSCSCENRQGIKCACTAGHLLGALQQNAWGRLAPSALAWCEDPEPLSRQTRRWAHCTHCLVSSAGNGKLNSAIAQ